MLLLLLVITCWSSSILAARTDEFCFGGCQQALRAVRFTDTDAKSRIALCQSNLGISSFYLCNKVYCTEENIQHGLIGLNETCMRFTNTYLPPFNIIANYTEDDIALLRQLQPEEAARTVTTTLGEVVVPSQKLFRLAFDTLATAYFESETHLLYGYAMYYFWAVVISIGLSTHLVTLIKSLQRQDLDLQPLLDGDDPALEEVIAVKRNSGPLRIPHTLLKRYIIVPATFGYRCLQNIKWCTIPPRIQSLTISAFIILNIVLCSISYHVFQDNMYWPDVSTQLYRYVSDRTGIISLANLPLIWLFGTRNNVLLWLTGWDFATYNHFHRWVARVATVEAVVHSIGYTIMILSRGGCRLYKIYWHKRYFFYGEIATIFMVAVCVFSVYGLRRRFYEIFLQIHIILSVFILIGMWYHVEIFSGEYNGYIWPCVFVWMFDRIFRLCRVLSFNPKFWNTIAVNTYDPDSNIVRLVVPHSTSFVKPRPGMYYYIYVLSDRRPWENHPFTLAHSTVELTGSSKSSSMSLGTITPPQRGVSSPTPGNRSGARHTASREIETLLTSSVNNISPSMTFLIRPYDSFTKRLQQCAIAGPAKLRVLIEGPYGHTQPLHKFNNILFIAGGTGIAMPLSYMEKLLHDDANVTSVRIVWAVREDEFLADVITTDFKTTLDNEKTSLAAYVTRATDIQKDQELQTRSKGIHVYQGRPDIHNEIEESARNSRHGSLAVIACGPGQMADDARRSVVNVLGKGWGHMEYFEESFSW